MTHQVHVFDTVVREFSFEVEDDFDFDHEDAVLELIDRVQKLAPIDETGEHISITVDGDEFYG